MNGSSENQISSALPAGMRIERIVNDVGLPASAILSLLKAAMGGDDTPPWPANQRWLLWYGDRLVAHVSAQQRWFVVHKQYYEGWHIGGVCVHPGDQRRGIGTLLMEQAHTDLSRHELGFAVLNCGSSLVRFYQRVGYTKISDRGMYLRDGELVIDADPAMTISLGQGFDVRVLRCQAFPFGFDF